MSIIRGGQIIESGEHRVYQNAGAPTNGAAGTCAGDAPKGALLVDTTNGALYINTNTTASPTWSSIPSTSQQLGQISVWNDTGVTLSANTLVYLSGFNAANDMPTAAKADADAGGKPAEYVVTADIADGASGTVALSWETAANLNTNAATVGDFVYLDTTAGGYVLTTAPTGATAVAQPVGYVKVKSATVGQIAFWLQAFKKIGANELQADSVRAAALGVTAGAITASRALVADANGNVAALKSTNLLLGASGSEKAQAGDCSFSVAGEAAHVIVTTVQLKDFAGGNLDQAINVDAWLSDAAGGIGTVVDPTSNTAVGGAGAVLTETGGLTHFTKLKVTSGSTGSFTVTTTQTAAQNYYLNVRLPNGVVKSSAVIAHAG